MAGDPLRDAFRTKLQAVIDANDGMWPFEDTLNTGVQPGVDVSFIDMDFALGRPEQQLTMGAPGANLWAEEGDVMIRLFPARNIGHDDAERFGRAIRNAFRGARFPMTTGESVRIVTVAPMGGGHNLDGWWCETIALAYRVKNTG